MSIVDTLKDVTIYGGIISFVLPRFIGRGSYKWREDAKVPLQPPGWVFAVAWIILYGLISASWIIALYRSLNEDIYTGIYVLYAVTALLMQAWLFVAGNLASSTWAFPIILLILGSAVALLVLLGVTQLWLSFGLFFPTALWLSLATYWNGYYAFTLGQPMVRPACNEKELPLLTKRGWGRA